MQINVLVEPLNGQGFRATGSAPFDIVAEGATRDEALALLKERVQERVAHGADVVTIDVGTPENPWLKMAGMYKGDPLFDEWQAAIREYREQVERDSSSIPISSPCCKPPW